MNKIILTALTLLGIMLLSGCDKVNNTEVPGYMVHIDLGTFGTWNIYGVTGVGDYRIFDRVMALDSSSGSYEPQAFDAACPVENRQDVTIGIDASNFEAVCPKCHSRYNVLTGMGGPISGVAYTSHYGLRQYKARATGNGGYVITSQ